MEKINMTNLLLKSDKLPAGPPANADKNDMLALLLDKVASPVVYIGCDYRYKYVNKAYTDWFGTDANEIDGSLVEKSVGYEAFGHIKAYMDKPGEGNGVHYEKEVSLRQGDCFVRVTCMPDIDENGNINGYVGMADDITEQKRTEQELKKSRGHFEKLLTSLPVAVYICDKNGRITFFNDVATKLWGYIPNLNDESLKFCACHKIWLPDGTSVAPDQTPMAIALQTGQSFRNAEAIVERPAGEKFHALANIDPLHDKEGNICGAINIFQDISEYKNTESALRKSEQKYRNLLHGLPAAIYTTDKDGYITLYNEAAADLWGRHPEMGKEMWCGSLKIYKPDGVTPLPLDTCPMAITLKERKKVMGEEIIIERPDGSRKYILPHPEPLFDSAGNITGAINMLLDITERKMAEEYSAKLAAIVQFSEDAVISKTTEGIITSWNPGAEKIYGYTEEEMIGQRITKLIPADYINEEPEILERIKKGERIDPYETKRIKKDGRLIDVSLSVSPIKDSSGKVTGASNIAHDISRQKEDRRLIHENEERLRMAGESAELGTWEFHPATKKMIWSDECKKIYGLSVNSEPQSSIVSEQNYPDDKEPIHREVEKAMDPDNDGNFKMEYRIIRENDKQVRWLKVQGKVFFDDDRKPQRFIGTMLDITEEKQAIQLIRESEERLKMAVESTKLGTWEYQLLTGKLKWSKECREIYNVPAEMEVDFNFFEEHIYPADREYAEAEIKKALDPDGDGDYDIQYRIIRYRDQQTRWIRAQGKVYFNDQNPERFIGTVLDITKEKLQQEELIESVELFQTMADNVPAMIWMSGTDKFNDYFNKTWLKFTGRTWEEESNEGWLGGVHPDDRQKCIDTYNNSLKEQEGFYCEYRLLRYDGRYRWIADNSTPRFSPGGVFLGFISACIDIDDQKRFSEKIQDSELLFKTISNTSPAALWMTDQNRKNIFVSDTWLKWTGGSFNDHVNRGWLSAVLEEDREKVINHFFECFEAGKNFTAEFRVPSIDGSMRWCLTEGKPYFDITGSFAGYAGSVTDITEIKKLEQRKDDFIKMASHELKTPITSINGYVQLLLNIYNEAETEKLQMSRSTVRSSLGTIAKQVTKLTRLISELLDLSRIESGKLELHCAEFKINELLEETVQDIRHTASRHAIISESNFEGKIYGDKDRIGQVLMNLLNNAIKYSPDADSVEVSLEGNSQSVTIRVKDYGIGIDKKDHQRIFERFYRVEGKTELTFPGFGIGLFIAGEIIHRHNGTIQVNSEKGKGSVFIIKLPIDFRQ